MQNGVLAGSAKTPLWRKWECGSLGASRGEFRLLATLGALTESLLEFLDATCGVDETLLTSKERVALGTNTDFEILHGGVRLIDSAASAADGGLVIFGVQICFHGREKERV